MGKITQEEKKTEALARMEMLHLSSYCKRHFQTGFFEFSEGLGSNYDIDDEDILADIRKFEAEYHGTVYHAIHNIFEFGECWSLLYVSDHKEEWASDKEDLQGDCKYPCVYVINATCPDCSEFGSIRILPMNGGLLRIE